MLWLLACVGAPEAPNDDDGDGFGEAAGDCDDGDNTVFPGADERCDGVDQDCDGAVDNTPVDGPSGYTDADQDGFGAGALTPSASCDLAPLVADNSDCDDAQAQANPGATEVCDAFDNNCDGTVDENAATEIPNDGVDQDCVPGVALPTTISGDAMTASFFSTRGGEQGSMALGADLNGDGQQDLIVGNNVNDPSRDDAIYVYLGPLSGEYYADDSPYYDQVADAHMNATAESAFGSSGTVLGDLDGDGTDDIAVGLPLIEAHSSGSVWLLSGDRLPTADGDADTLAVIATSSTNDFGSFLATADDGGLLASAAHDTGTGSVYLFPLAAFPWFNVTEAACQVTSTNQYSFFGYSSNADGEGGFWVSEVIGESGLGAVYHFESCEGLMSPADADTRIRAEDYEVWPGYTMAGPFAQADGTQAILAAFPAEWSAPPSVDSRILMLPSTGLSAAENPDAWSVLTDNVPGSIGTAMTLPGDVDDDGVPDVMLRGTEDYYVTGSSVAIFSLDALTPGAPLLYADAKSVLTGPTSQYEFGHATYGPGDLGGDGAPDMLVVGELPGVGRALQMYPGYLE